MERKPSLGQMAAGRRKSITLTSESLVRTGFPEVESPVHYLVEAVVEGLNLTVWAAENRGLIDESLRTHGAILFRNFAVADVDEFQSFAAAAAGSLLDYSYGSTPRSPVKDKIYTSTEYPADQSIPLHNEMSYSRSWPMKILFCSLRAATEGGETPLADSRRVFESLDPAITRTFAQKNVMYIRNYGEHMDLPWQRVFNTTDRSEAEEFCRRAAIEFEWRDKNRLRTWQVCQGVAIHPRTTERVWFNQAHLFHVSSLEGTVGGGLLSYWGSDDLPRDARYGDGSAIESDALAEIREVYDAKSRALPWREGDVLLLDNMLVAHGRRPFKGERKVVVAMGELSAVGMSWQD